MCFKTLGLFKCGKCPECLQERRNDWAIRLIQEARLFGCFSALLTYRPSDVPMTKDGQMTLCKKDVQKFLKRLRYKFDAPFKYYISAEYSPEAFRPHYHCLFFGFPKDLSQNQINQILSETWKLGFIGSYSNWINSDAQINYALGYLMSLYEWDKEDSRERPWRLLSKGIALEYIPTEGLVVNKPINSDSYGWTDRLTGELIQKDPSIVLYRSPNHNVKIDFLKGPNEVPFKEIKYLPNRYDYFVFPFDADGNLNYDYSDGFDVVKIQQTKFNVKTRTTTLGKVQSFKMPRRWRENMLSDSDRLILRELNKIKSKRRLDNYLDMYGEFDRDSNSPMWKEIKKLRWKQKKKNKKDKLINNPDSFL